jgi:hypothetical protein
VSALGASHQAQHPAWVRNPHAVHRPLPHRNHANDNSGVNSTTGGGGGDGAGGGAGISLIAVGNASGVNGRAIYGIGHKPQPGGQIILLPGKFPITSRTGGGGGGGGGGGAGISVLLAGNVLGDNSPNYGPGGRQLPKMTVLPRTIPVHSTTGGGGGNGAGGAAGISFQFVGNAIGNRQAYQNQLASGKAGRGTSLLYLPRSLPINTSTGGGGGGGGGGGAGISFVIGGNALWWL